MNYLLSYLMLLSAIILVMLQYMSIKASVEEEDFDYLMVAILSNIGEIFIFIILGGYNG